MRQIGTLSDAGQARVFQDYALTLGVRMRLEQDDGRWDVWVFDEDQVERAKQELDKYSTDPHQPIYREASDAARHLRNLDERKQEQARKNTVNVRDRWSRAFTSRAPVTAALLAAMITVSALSRFGEQHEPLLTTLAIASYEPDGRWNPEEGLSDVRSGEVWRLVTPIFIHFGLIHILFNSLMLFQLGGVVETRHGSWRFLLMVLAIAIPSNLVQYLATDPGFGGMSGVVYGLFGYIWMQSRFSPESGFFMPHNTVIWLMLWFFMGVAGVIPNIANWAHGVGLIAGMVLGYAPSFWQNAVRR